MATPFKIPKRKQPSDTDSAHVHLRSPLSRLHSTPPQFKSYGAESSRGGGSSMHAGNSHGSSTDIQRAPSCKLPFRDEVKMLLGLNTAAAATANHRAPGRSTGQSQMAGQRAEPWSTTNGWRPKRASDRLLQPELSSTKRPPPPQKKSTDQSPGLSPLSSPSSKIISVETVDSLARLRSEEHAGSQRKGAEPGQDTGEQKALLGPRRSLDRTAWKSSAIAIAAAMEDAREAQRRRWREFKERRTNQTPRQTRTMEPIVLSSEEEEEEEEEEEQGGGGDASQSAGPTDQSEPSVHTAPPSFLQLHFSSLHAGLTHTLAAAAMTVTEDGIILPLTVSGEESGAEPVEVTVVASQVRGFGVWDGAMARGGALLDGWTGPAPAAVPLGDGRSGQTAAERSGGAAEPRPPGPPCSFLLLVLKEQLQELQKGLLFSILDMEEYKKGRCSSSSSSSSSCSCSCSSPCGGLTSPLNWTDGLLLLHTCPPPLDQHLLSLLGQSTEESSPVRRSQRRRRCSLSSSGLQQLPTRLIQYPAPPSRGRISVTQEDLSCLDAGEFLNDVIIDFYLKFLLLERASGPVSERCHVFSSFFFKQLSRRRAAGEDHAPSLPDRHMRHQRVKTWTRHIDIFTKDFLFVPVNQESHWFLVVVCFPGLEKLQYEESTGASERAAGKPHLSLRPPACTELGCRSATRTKRPCVLVMDSLKLSYHDNVCRLIRDYLQVEWEVRRRTPRLFTGESVPSCRVRVPQQDNSSDCGVYLLQYAESFLQNPVVHFDLPVCLDNWFPRQRVRQKREEIRGLILKMYESQKNQNDVQ